MYKDDNDFAVFSHDGFTTATTVVSDTIDKSQNLGLSITAKKEVNKSVYQIQQKKSFKLALFKPRDTIQK
jgi:hypothetical protein